MSDAGCGSSDVAHFYEGRSVFITGASGFMGKVLIEKLLRSCPGIGNIYILMRPKKGNDVMTRLQMLVNTKIFDWLRENRPNAVNKIIPVTGELSLPNLGVSDSDEEILVKNVSIVFHMGATVRFDETLKYAVQINLLGTKRLVQLCRKMEKLEALIYTSTAYSNCDREEVDEVLYPAPADPEKILNCVELLDDELLETITPQIVKGLPNTYIFAKALAEHLFVNECAGLPGAIVRPSIVAPAWKEPLNGWTENLNGISNLVTGAGKGILRTMFCYDNLIIDLVPVDVAINLSISTAWYTAIAKPDNVLIYNCTTGSLNPMRWIEMRDYAQISHTKTPFNDVFWYPGGGAQSSKLLNKLLSTCLHTVPAHILDAISRAKGEKPIMVRIQKKAHRAMHFLEHFTTHEWKFSSNNVRKLYKQLSEQDKVTFNFDVKQIRWPEYMDDFVKGVRLYILKQSPDSIPSAKRHLMKLYIIHRAAQLFLIVFLWRMFMLLFESFHLELFQGYKEPAPSCVTIREFSENM